MLRRQEDDAVGRCALPHDPPLSIEYDRSDLFPYDLLQTTRRKPTLPRRRRDKVIRSSPIL
jgi:hypothetical protein